MTQEHPITPPPELLQEWCQQGHNCISELDALKELATQAARWGADQELEACCEWLNREVGTGWGHGTKLRAARRPKPPSLKDKALAALQVFGPSGDLTPDEINAVRRALESLPE